MADLALDVLPARERREDAETARHAIMLIVPDFLDTRTVREHTGVRLTYGPLCPFIDRASSVKAPHSQSRTPSCESARRERRGDVASNFITAADSMDDFLKELHAASLRKQVSDFDELCDVLRFLARSRSWTARSTAASRSSPAASRRRPSSMRPRIRCACA